MIKYSGEATQSKGKIQMGRPNEAPDNATGPVQLSAADQLLLRSKRRHLAID